MIQTASLSLALPVTTRSPAQTGQVVGDFAGSFAQANAGAAAEDSAAILPMSASAGPATPLIVAPPEHAVRQDIAATGNGLPTSPAPGRPTLPWQRAIVSPATDPQVATPAETEAPPEPLAEVVPNARGLKSAPKLAKPDPVLQDIAASPALIASPFKRIDRPATPDAETSDTGPDAAPAGQATPLALVPADPNLDASRTERAVIPQPAVAGPVQDAPPSASAMVVASPIARAKPVRADLQTVATSTKAPSRSIAPLTEPMSAKRTKTMVEGAPIAQPAPPANDSSPSLTVDVRPSIAPAPARQSSEPAIPALAAKPLAIAPTSGTHPVGAVAIPQQQQSATPTTDAPAAQLPSGLVAMSAPAPASAVIATSPIAREPLLGTPRWIATEATTPVTLIVARPDPVQPQPGTVAAAAQVFGAAIQAATKLRDDSKDWIGDAATAIAFGTSPEIKAADIRAAGAQQAPLDMRQERWPHAMIDRIEILRDAVNASDTRIRLIPDALGAIDVSVKRDGDTVHVHFNAEQAATRTLLQDAQPRLVELAEARGLKLGQSALSGGTDGGQAGTGQQRAPTASRTPPPSPSSSSVTAGVADDTRIA